MHQNAHSHPQRSVSRWSKPQTPAEIAYFSTHAPKRRVYGIVQTAVQIIWAAISFIACKNLFDWAFSHTPGLLWLSDYLAALTLVTLHVLLRTTYNTYWYDRLDNRTETDSSFFLPLLIMAGLVWLDYEGAKTYLTGQVERQNYIPAAPIDSAFQNQVLQIQHDHERRRAEIESIFEQKATAAALPYDQQIKRLERAKADNSDEARYIAGKLSKLRQQRDQAVTRLLDAKADSLNAAFSAHNNRLNKAEQRREKLLDKVDTHNENEDARHREALAGVNSYAWLISLFFMVVFAALGYAIVRINVKSGILPVREYTDLDQHGGALEKIGLAVNDGAKRQMHRFAVWLHNTLSANARELTDFDGNVIVRPPNSQPPGASARTPTPANEPPNAAALADALLNGHNAANGNGLGKS
jgi:hypothetical protein